MWRGKFSLHGIVEADFVRFVAADGYVNIRIARFRRINSVQKILPVALDMAHINQRMEISDERVTIEIGISGFQRIVKISGNNLLDGQKIIADILKHKFILADFQRNLYWTECRICNIRIRHLVTGTRNYFFAYDQPVSISVAYLEYGPASTDRARLENQFPRRGSWYCKEKTPWHIPFMNIFAEKIPRKTAARRKHPFRIIDFPF